VIVSYDDKRCIYAFEELLVASWMLGIGGCEPCPMFSLVAISCHLLLLSHETSSCCYAFHFASYRDRPAVLLLFGILEALLMLMLSYPVTVSSAI
jgi:hypothetical protein